MPDLPRCGLAATYPTVRNVLYSICLACASALGERGAFRLWAHCVLSLRAVVLWPRVNPHLHRKLVRGLRYALRKYAGASEADLAEFAQEALLKILAALKSYQGESRFTTWALKIAVHTAFSELRRRRWRDVSLEEMTVPTDTLADRASTEQQAVQGEVLGVMRGVIMEELPDREREALVAVRFFGMPIAEVAHRMGSNPDALYKLLLDARKRLKSRMLARGLSRDDLLVAVDMSS